MTTFKATSGDDVFTGQKPYDDVSYADAASGVTVDLSASGPQNTGGSGSDTFVSITGLIGSGYGDTLTGNEQANQLFGGAGDDVLSGGAGLDVWDQGLDVLDGGEGIDTAVYSGNRADYQIDQRYPDEFPTQLYIIGAEGWDYFRNIEFLRFADGTINVNNMPGMKIVYSDVGDFITGTVGSDTIHALAGSDTVYGQFGYDRIYGGLGDDWLDGGEGNDTLHGDSGADLLVGGAGNDRLDGGEGIDTMDGGLGNDTYTVDDSADIVIEAAGGGTLDRVNASVSFALSANVEKLTLTGADAIDGTGNDLANTLVGNDGDNLLRGLAGKDLLNGGAGDDRLVGGAGADSLTGGEGNDTFVFDTLGAASDKDTIKDFTAGADRVEIVRSAFAALADQAPGALSASEFVIGTKALTENQHIIYNSASGALYYDDDGNGAHLAVQIANFIGKPMLAADDIFLV